MQKIISLYKRDYEVTRLVYDEVVPGAEWVLAGEGVATRKYDGTCCMVERGRLFKRYDAKKGKTPPPFFVPAQEAPDPVTGHWPGWVPVSISAPSDKYHREAWHDVGESLNDGTYELCGPMVQGNPEGFQTHTLVPHGSWKLPDAPRTFEALKAWLADHDIEGIVWWHPDGRMVKIKKKDFGLPRRTKA